MTRGCGVARPKPWDVGDELWAVIEPLLPKVERRARHPGRKRHLDRLVFQGISSCCTPGSPGNTFRRNSASGSGMTCWRRLAEWTEAGCGHCCTRSSSPSSAARTPWTSPARLSTAPTSAC
ncbi:transposase [Streptomyces tendae]